MFLFDKKTRNVIKYIWGFFAIIIIFSMVFAFSGFGELPSAPPANQVGTIDLSPEDIAALRMGEEGVEMTEEEFAEMQAQMPGAGASLGNLSPEEVEELRQRLLELDESHELRGLLDQLPPEPAQDTAQTGSEQQLDLSL